MSKSLLHRWFGWGGVPARKRPALEAEGIVFAEVGLRSSITFRHYKSPTSYCNWRKQVFIGSCVLTRKRFAVYSVLSTKVEIPLAEGSDQKIEFTLEEPNRLRVTFEASDFIPRHSGQVILRFRTEEAPRLFELSRH